jgi:peptidoglycan hydrolase-like protein with peptidoglycan-binding domain
MTKIQHYFALLALVTVMGATPAVSVAETSASYKDASQGGLGVSAPVACKVAFDADMFYGSSDPAGGGAVFSLQSWLSENGYLSAKPTGYFGTLTRDAVKHFQRDAGLPETGYFGMLTRAEVAKRLCAGGTPVDKSGNFTASPASGKAPLAVSFSVWLVNPDAVAKDYYFDFGDGMSAAMRESSEFDCGYGTRVCSQGARTIFVSHTYEKAGTYTATLNKRYHCPEGSEVCPALYSIQVASTTVSVYGREESKENLTIKVRTNRSSYGQDDPILVRVTASNTSNNATRLTWSTDCQASYMIGSVYDSQDGMACTEAFTSRVIPAHSSRTWRMTHDPDDYELSPGTHMITGTLIGYGSADAKIEVTD